MPAYKITSCIDACWGVSPMVCGFSGTEMGGRRDHVHLRHHEMIEWPCPECGAACKLYDHQPERRWRHLDTCQYQTIQHAEPTRTECGDHGVKAVRRPCAEPSSRFTALFEIAGNYMVEGGRPKGGGRVVEAQLGRGPRHHRAGGQARIAEAQDRTGPHVVDEKAFRKGHSYLTLVND